MTVRFFDWRPARERSGPPNKGMNLTSALPRFARWHGRRSQVMPGVRRTEGEGAR